MSKSRAVFTIGGLLFCLLFSGAGLYAVNANGSLEPVVGGYGVIAQ